MRGGRLRFVDGQLRFAVPPPLPNNNTPSRPAGVPVTSFRSQWLRRAATGLLLALAASPAFALEYRLQAGRSVVGRENPTTVLYADVAGAERSFRGWRWQPVGSLGAIHARRGATDLQRHTTIGSVGLRLLPGERLFMSIQFGYASGITSAISSHEQFVSDIGWTFGRAVLSVRHISNGNLFGGRNRGETMLLLGLDL
jgi:hypothetical protein